MPVSASTNTAAQAQAQYIDTQDAKLDIDAIYSNIIGIIDQYRSHVNVVNNQALITQIIATLNGATQPNQQLLVDPNPQESRCSAFYRLIGLPVVSSNGLYSPGFDASTTFLTQVQTQHYQVINSLSSSGIFALMDTRETYINAIYSIFAQSNPTSNTANLNASVLAISSVAGGQVRQFSISQAFLTSAVFDVDPTDQSYKVLGTNSTGATPLATYTDINSNPPSIVLGNNIAVALQNPLQVRAHFVKPFMTDPRVDLTAQPPQAKICAPFILNSSKSIYAGDSSTGIVLIRPFIEYVITNRFAAGVNTTAISSARNQAIQQYIQNTNSVSNQSLLDAVTQPAPTTLEDQEFLRNFNIMRAMIDRLCNAMVEIQQTESIYHWLPIPDPVLGLEGDIGTQSILLQTLGSGPSQTVRLDQLATTREQKIMTLTAQIELAAPNVQPVSPDLGGFAFASVQPLPDSNVSSGFGSTTQTSLTNAVTARTTSTNKAAMALRDIEIIMGEFTGFGLCDAIAIYAALWTVDPTTLINMIDTNAYTRMTNNQNISAPAQSTMPPMTVLQNFEMQVKTMYQLMDSLYLSRQLNMK